VICRFWVGRFQSDVQMISSTQPSKSVVNRLNRLYEEDRHQILAVRNLTNLFKNGLIGSRPMYRDDILFDGNVAFLEPNLKVIIIFRYNNILYAYIVYTYRHDLPCE